MADSGNDGGRAGSRRKWPPGRLADGEAVLGWGVAFLLWCLLVSSPMSGFGGPPMASEAAGADPWTPVARVVAVAVYAVVPAAMVGIAVVMVLNRWPRRPLPETAHVALYAVVPYVLLAGLGAGRAALFGEPVAPVWTEPIGLVLTVAPSLCSAAGRATVIPLRRRRMAPGLPQPR